MKTGKIVIGIDRKVYFEYYESKRDFRFLHTHELEQYEASKRLIDVSNDYIVSPLPGTAHLWIQDTSRLRYLVKSGQKCKAEVNGTAKIIELL